MDGLITTYGAEFLAGSPHPGATGEDFARRALGDPRLRGLLSRSRWRLLRVRPHDELDKAGDRDFCRSCEAVFYDYSNNRTLTVRGPAGGQGPVTVESSSDQPVPSSEEFEDAAALVARSPVWGNLLQTGAVKAYRPMPPVLEGEGVERTLYVGLISRPRQFNRIVAVNMVRREVSAAGVKPRGASAGPTMCGQEPVSCFPPRPGTPGSVVIRWPAKKPVWTFRAYRPAADVSGASMGSGIELRNVRYRGCRVLKQAHVPILNVQYEEDACGPFRDWLYQESCFEAIGRSIQGVRGFRWCKQAPRTILESGLDGGNFTGVAVYEAEDDALVLVSQCEAGWYRYVMEWRFYRDGTLLPRFRFGAVQNSCVCVTHHHHTYWRLDFDIYNTSNVVDQLVGDVWQPIEQEVSVRRPEGEELRWRVRHARRNMGYEIIPGAQDGVGDGFSGDDQYLLRYRGVGEVDDHPKSIGEEGTRLGDYVQGEPVSPADVVVWYVAHFRHEVDEEGDPHEIAVGPTLRPFNWPRR